MDKIITQKIYSPRSGCEISCQFNFSDKEIIIKIDTKKARCFIDENGSIKWSGYEDDIGNPLINILENERIYPPTIFTEALIYIWDSWKKNNITDSILEKELSLLINWVNDVSKFKPNSEFWVGVF